MNKTNINICKKLEIMEKTLEELIIHIIDNEGNVSAQDVLKLLEQVREATIAECLQLAIKETIIMSRKSQFDLIPTDRIKLTE